MTHPHSQPGTTDEIDQLRRDLSHAKAMTEVWKGRAQCGVQTEQVPDLLAATLSYSGKEITIQCNDFDVRDAIYDWLMHQASALPSAEGR